MKDPLKLFFIFLAALSIFYFSVIADKLYSSKASITINSTDQKNIVNGMINIGGVSNQQEKDSRILIEYLKSYEALNQIDKVFKLDEEYIQRVDPLYSLSKNYTKEEFLTAYQKNIKTMEYDPRSGIISIEITGSNKESLSKITDFIIEIGNKKINDYGFSLANNQLLFVEKLMLESKNRLELSESKLLSFQSKNTTIDPKVEIDTKSGLIAQLEGDLAKKESELNKLSSYMSKDSFEIKSLIADISGIKSQIFSLKKSIASTDKQQLNIKLYDFEKLKAEVEFNRNVYKNAVEQYEIAKVESIKQSKSISLISVPTTTDEPIYPNVFKNILISLIVIYLLYLAASTIKLIIREHQH